MSVLSYPGYTSSTVIRSNNTISRYIIRRFFEQSHFRRFFEHLYFDQYFDQSYFDQLTLPVLSDVAQNEDSFSSLTSEDQAVLIKSNGSLYVQYILARYFNASSGLEQVMTIKRKLTIQVMESGII